MAVAVHRFRCYVSRSFLSINPLISSSHAASYVRRLHTSRFVLGLEEFFPPGVLDKGEIPAEEVRSGRRWSIGELRGKSNEDLQKLWYVLLKERNMLNTVMHDAKRNGVPMPSPERYHKVQKSMATIKTVIAERESVLRELEKQTWAFDTETTEQPSEALEQVSSETLAPLEEQQSNKEGIFSAFRRKIFSRIWRTA